jgi:hypothetical protein
MTSLTKSLVGDMAILIPDGCRQEGALILVDMRSRLG